MRRKLWVVLFSLLAIVLVVAPTMAGWGAGWGSGSVYAFGTVTGLKNAQKNGATVLATVGAYGSRPFGNLFIAPQGAQMPGVVWCGNPGNSQIVQGVNPVFLTINFSGTELIAGTSIDKNGKAPFNIHAVVDSNSLNTQFNPAVLCPGKNWKIVDFVPSKFSGLLRGYSGDPSAGGTLLTQSVYDCDGFQDGSSITTLKYKEQRAYACKEVIDQRVN